MQSTDIDLEDLDRFVDAVPHDVFQRLRNEAPVHFHRERNGGPGFWTVSKYHDLITVSKDNRTFSSYRGGTNIFDLSEEQLAEVRSIMLNMDPPAHSKYRKLVSQVFVVRIISALEPHVRELASRIIDDVVERGECDFVTEIAAELPLQVIAEFLGVPHDERKKLFEWSNKLIGFDDPEFQNSMDEGRMAAMEIYMYANQLAAQRRERPESDIVTRLLQGEVDGERLTEQEFDSFFLLLAIAGNETTRNLISGGMLALLEHPEQWRRLKANPALMPTAVEEMLRWVSPVMHFRRTATRDTVLRGQPIREGDKIVMFYPSANRDEEIFPNADQFDIGRTPNEHIAFGIGEHFCLGSNLARLEIRIIFEELVRRLPDIELAGPARRLRSNFINGIKTMPVRFHRQAQPRSASRNVG